MIWMWMPMLGRRRRGVGRGFEVGLLRGEGVGCFVFMSFSEEFGGAILHSINPRWGFGLVFR